VEIVPHVNARVAAVTTAAPTGPEATPSPAERRPPEASDVG